jgi:putative transposase
MKAVADTLGVARSNLVEQAKRDGSRPRSPYRKAGDAELLARIRSLVDARPSDGVAPAWPAVTRSGSPLERPTARSGCSKAGSQLLEAAK